MSKTNKDAGPLVGSVAELIEQLQAPENPDFPPDEGDLYEDDDWWDYSHDCGCCMCCGCSCE